MKIVNLGALRVAFSVSLIPGLIFCRDHLGRRYILHETPEIGQKNCILPILVLDDFYTNERTLVFCARALWLTKTMKVFFMMKLRKEINFEIKISYFKKLVSDRSATKIFFESKIFYQLLLQ